MEYDKYKKYDTAEISKTVLDTTIKIRGFLNYDVDVAGKYKKTIYLIVPHKKKLRMVVLTTGPMTVLPCRMVLFEKYIMNPDKIIRPVRKRVSAKG